MKLNLLFILLLLSPALYGQHQLEGKVVDDKNQPIFFSTIVLYQKADTSIVQAVTSEEDGTFRIDQVADGDFMLQVTMLGFEASSFEGLSLPADQGKTFHFKLEPDVQVLDEVVVTSKLPLIEQKADRLIVNIENSLLGSSGTLMDALKSVPGMITSTNGIRLAGQSNLTILINGKSTQFMDIASLLQSIPAQNIKQIEVIHQPGAEFEASGTGPIINIILRKNKLLGTNGRIGGRVNNDFKLLYWTGLSLSHYQGDVNINSYIGYATSAQRDNLTILRNVNDDSYLQTSINPNILNSFGSNLSVDWEISDKQSLGVAGQYWSADKDQTQRSTTAVDFASIENEDIALVTENIQDADWSYYVINPYYSIFFDTSAHKLDIDYSRFGFEANSFNEISSVNTLNPNEFFPGQEFTQPGENNIEALKIDYTNPLNDHLKLDLGGKLSDANLDNNLGVVNVVSEDISVPDTLLSNHFLFSEQIRAAYMKLTYQKGDFSSTIGLRFEDSFSEGTSLTTGDVIERKISRLFPSASIRTKLFGPISSSVAYSYRIDRPSYFDLNPFTTKLDPFTGMQGNPTLIPSLTHSTRFNLIYGNYPFFNLEYKIINDPMVEVTEQNDETGETFLTTVNLDNQRVFNAQLLVPLDFLIDKISGFAGVTANYNKYNSPYLGEEFIRSRWTYTIFGRASFILPKKFESEIGVTYVSGVLDGIMELNSFYNVNIGFGRKFLDDKLRVNLLVNDVIFRYKSGRINFSSMDITFAQTWVVPRASLTVSYNFGNQFLSEKEKRKLGAEEEIGRSTQN